MANLIRLADNAMAVLRSRASAGLPAIGKSLVSGSDRIVAISPDEWLVIAADEDAEGLCQRLARFDGAVVDVSGNRVTYRVPPDRATWFLSAGCSMDLVGLEAGDAVSTVLARAQVILVVEADGSYLVLPRRSFAHYIEAWAEMVHD